MGPISTNSADHEAALRTQLDRALEHMRGNLVELRPRATVERIGVIVSVGDDVAVAEGLSRPVFGELVEVGGHGQGRVGAGSGGVVARAEAVSDSQVRLVLLGRREHGDASGSPTVEAGATVRRTGRILEVPAGPGLLGRVVDPLGAPVDGRGPLAATGRIRIERDQVPLADRELVTRPLRTGVFTLDTMIPIGRGQRQLIIGDRSTGKTELCLDILAALDPDIVPVYVAIGRRGSEIATTVDELRDAGVLARGFCVVSHADDPLGLVHLTPYSACAMAESLAEAGRDVVIVYDDLSSHANAHRSLALLLGRPVGREAHPVDVFYAHARLLERATQLGPGRGGGSLTALPIIETQAGDLTGYIPTNLVSITDGQIRLDAALLAAGLEPAIDVGLSVSRVGGKAQPALVRRLSGSLKNRYAQFLELEAFARFGTRLEAQAQAVVDWGRRARAVLGQGRGQHYSWAETVARILLVGEARFVELPQAEIAAHIDRLVVALVAKPGFDQAGIDHGRVAPRAIPALAKLARECLDAQLDATQAQANQAEPEPGSEPEPGPKPEPDPKPEPEPKPEPDPEPDP